MFNANTCPNNNKTNDRDGKVKICPKLIRSAIRYDAIANNDEVNPTVHDLNAVRP